MNEKMRVQILNNNKKIADKNRLKQLKSAMNEAWLNNDDSLYKIYKDHYKFLKTEIKKERLKHE